MCISSFETRDVMDSIVEIQSTINDTIHSNFSSNDFNVEEQLAVETARSNFKSFAISTIKNCAVLFVGCALATIAVFIAIIVYYKLQPRNESQNYASITSTIDLKVSKDLLSIGKY